MNFNPRIHNQTGMDYSEKYLVIPIMGSLMIIIMFMYLNSESFTLPGIIPWPDSAAGKVIALVGQYILIFLPILLLCAVFLGLTAFIPHLHNSFQRVRQDWSLISYLLYGLSLFIIFVSSDEYHGLGYYQLASLIILGIGTLSYLSPASSLSRLFKLLFALGLSMGVLGLGIYLIYPQQSWSVHTSFPRWWEAIWPLLVGISLAVNMTIPALLNYLPRGKDNPL